MAESQIYLQEVIKVASIPIIYNGATPSANLEYLKRIGTVKKFTLKARGGIFKVAFSSNQSGVVYIKLADGISYSEDLIETEELFTIYFQSDTIGAVLEMICWK